MQINQDDKSTQKQYKSHAYNVSLTLLISDLISISLSFALAILVREVADPLFKLVLQDFSSYLPLILLNAIIILLIFGLVGLYRGYGNVAVLELRNIIKSIFIAFVILTFSTYLVGQGARLPRTIFLLSLLFCLIFVPLFRLVIYNRFSRFDKWGVNVVVIGASSEFPDIINRLHRIRRFGFNPAVILCTNFTPAQDLLTEKIPIYAFSTENCLKLRERGIRYAFYAAPISSADDAILIEISRVFSTIYVILPESGLSSLWIETTDLLGRPALKVHYQLLEKFSTYSKRSIEISISLLVLLVTFPLSLLAFIMIKLENKGPVIFTQKRYGVNGQIIDILKFRTMIPNADAVLIEYLQNNPKANEEYYLYHKLKTDPRITWVGKLLRKFSLDELPQFINVIRGDMNLIGPRAYMTHELDLSNELTQTILRVRPGITGWWQVMGRNSTTFEERQKLDFYYIKNWSLWLDLYILFKTLWIIISGQGK